MSGISSKRLALLAEDFWNTNCNKSCVPYSKFVPSVQKVLLAHQCNPTTALPEDLMTILVEHFSLSVEAQTSSLTHSPLLPEWYSDFREDLSFGASGDFLRIFFLSVRTSQKSKISYFLNFLLEFYIGPSRLLSTLEGREVLELAKTTQFSLSVSP